MNKKNLYDNIIKAIDRLIKSFSSGKKNMFILTAINLPLMMNFYIM